MIVAGRHADHAALMNRIYGFQRHFYDASRKYYLLGRDAMIAGLAPQPGDGILELGCGTGRNLVLAARLHPEARLYGLDISAAMLETAATKLGRHGLEARVQIARGDAVDFSARHLFDRDRFERIFFSYALSMIPGWTAALETALAALAPGGSLHIVDFGSQQRLPAWCRSGLRIWLGQFHVTPRDTLESELRQRAGNLGAALEISRPYRDYAIHAVLRLPAA
jgi:S-adenosylmethionine-diacylgycerolhomoserine-N-methlytransferase